MSTSLIICNRREDFLDTYINCHTTIPAHLWTTSNSLSSNEQLLTGTCCYHVVTARSLDAFRARLGSLHNCAYVLLLGGVALVAQRPIVIKLSRGRSVGLSSALWKMADRIRMSFGILGRTGPGMRQVVGFGDGSTGMGTFGPNLGRAIVTNGDFTAYVCDSAATRPSSQITLGRLVR